MEMVLRLPSNYIEVEQDEMMYLDGGATYSTPWWGYSITMSRTESVNLQYFLRQGAILGYGGAVIAAGMAVILSIPSAGLGTIIATSIGILAVSGGVYCDLMQNSLSHHTTSRGVVLNISKIAVFWSKGR